MSRGENHPDDVWIIEPRSAELRGRLREIWRYRHLLRYFAFSTIRRTYKATVLGWLWIVIRVLVPVFIGTIIFHELAGVAVEDLPYFLFYLVGTSIWHLFEENLMWATRSLQIHRSLLTKLYFPRLILPAATLAPGLVEFFVHLLLIIGGGIFFFVVDKRWYLLIGSASWYAVAGVLLSLILALGIGFFTAVLGAEKRDVRFTLRYILQFWFYLTPIIYPVTLIPEQFRWIAAINPMTTVVELFKHGLLGTDSGLTVGQVAGTLLTVSAIFAAGLRFFIQAEAESIDRL